jgi:pimeloyl-ACP methyl ester carboxylesterase
MTNKKIYLIPGLGADGRMYTPQLKVLKNAVVLEHQKPLKGETLAEYAHRLSAKIDTSEPFILVGTSLGGMISVEMAKVINADRVILISSVKHRDEMPRWIRAMKYLRFHKLLSGANFIRFSNANVKRLITKRDTTVAKLLVEMHNSADPEFVGWAINAVVNWNGAKDYRHDIIHIHGTRDQLFPHHNIEKFIAVKGGSHVMGLTQAQDVNKALLDAIG